MGIDPASGQSGIAIVDDEELLHSEVWKKTAVLSLATNLAMFAARCSILLQELDVPVIRIERVSVTMNLNTVRKIAYFEAAAMIAAAGRAKVVQCNVGSARKAVFGHGGMKKVEAAERIRALYGDELTLDECDAIVMALAHSLDT
jgi:Holliday junction resolvasome RuvABC endonuclease subunit